MRSFSLGMSVVTKSITPARGFAFKPHPLKKLTLLQDPLAELIRGTFCLWKRDAGQDAEDGVCFGPELPKQKVLVTSVNRQRCVLIYSIKLQILGPRD